MKFWLAAVSLSDSFLPHGHCFLWIPSLLWLTVLSDLFIALAYFSIPVCIWILLRQRKDIPEPRVLILFSAFICLCGTTHLLAAWNIWNTDYWIEAGVKAATALVSVLTACLLIPTIRRLTTLPSHTALARSEARYRRLAETAAEGILLLDAKGTTVFANQRIADMLGYSLDEILGNNFLDFIPPEEYQTFTHRMLEREEGTPAQYRSRFKKRNGALLPVLVATNPVLEDDDTTGMLSVITDLSEQTRVEEELRKLTAELEARVHIRTAELETANKQFHQELEQRKQMAQQLAEREARLSAILDSTVDGIIVIDEKGTIESVNPAASEMFAYPIPALLGRNVSMLMDTPHRESHDQYLRNYLEQGIAKIIGSGREVMGKRSDGTLISIDLSVSETLVGGERRFVGMLRNVSERRTQEANIATLNRELQEANQKLQKQIELGAKSGIAITEVNERLREALATMHKQADTHAVMQEMSELLQACRTQTEGAVIIGRFAQRLFEADSGTIYLHNEANQLNAVYVWGAQNESDNNIRTNDCWSVRSGRPYPLTSTQRDMPCSHLHMESSRYSICLPLFAQGELHGVVCLRRDRPFASASQGWDNERLRIKQTFAQNTALCLASLALRERLEEQSTRDVLTKLFNRRYGLDQLEMETTRAKRHGTPVSVMLIDIDHFKQINDRFGHDTGDRALVALSRLLAKITRAGDVACRWGGEEFLVLLAGANSEIAQKRAELLRHNVETQITVNNDIGMTVSIGVATLPDCADNWESLVDAADQALYAAKHAGRNRALAAPCLPTADDEIIEENPQPQN